MQQRASLAVLGIVSLLAAYAANPARALTAGAATATRVEGLPTATGERTNPPPILSTTEVINSQPDCAPAGAYTRCHDAVLGVTFDYPARRGALGAQLATDAHAGQAYAYTFSPGQAGLQAGVIQIGAGVRRPGQ